MRSRRRSYGRGRTVSPVRWAAAAALALALALASSAADAAVTASLSASAIAPGDTVQLTLERTGQAGGQPDLAPLNRDFDVLGTASSSSFEINNGVASSTAQLTVTLSPKHAGQLQIPPLRWGNEQSPALSLTVSAGAAGSSSAGPAGSPAGTAGAAASGVPREFLETSLDTSQPLVQAAVHLTVRLYTAETLYHAALTLGGSSDVLVQQLGGDEQSSEQRGGIAYRVVTRHYLLFPQHSGTLTLAGPVLDAQVADNRSINPAANDPFARFFGGGAFGGFVTTRPIRLHGEPIVLNVRARPAAAVARSYWLPARTVTLTSQWQPAPLRAHAGDPVTVQLHLQAQGLTAAQLPDLSALWQLPAGVNAYPDQPKLHDDVRGGSLIGSRDQTIALIADQPGSFTIPALPVHWWDTQSNAPRVTTLPAQTLHILPAAGAVAPAPAQSPAASIAPAPASVSAPAPVSTPAPASAPASVPAAHAAPRAATPVSATVSSSDWRWACVALAALWLLTLALWAWSARRRRPMRLSRVPRPGGDPTPAQPKRGAPAKPGADPARARSALDQACRRADALAARQALLAWAAAQWPDAPPRGLGELSRLLDPQLTVLLRELDRACYVGEPWKGEQLLASLGALRAQNAAEAAGRRARRGGEALAPLYP